LLQDPTVRDAGATRKFPLDVRGEDFYLSYVSHVVVLSVLLASLLWALEPVLANLSSRGSMTCMFRSSGCMVGPPTLESQRRWFAGMGKVEKVVFVAIQGRCIRIPDTRQLGMSGVDSIQRNFAQLPRIG